MSLVVLALHASTADALDLPGCLASAERAHPQVAAARAAVAAARARTAIGFGNLWPTVSGELSYNVLGGARAVGGGAAGGDDELVEVYTAGLNARATLWDFGRTTNAWRSTEDLQAAARSDERTALSRLRVEAEAAWRTTLAATELVVAAGEARNRADAQLVRARARVELGLRPTFDVTRAQVEVANSELLLLAARNAESLGRARLASACGLETLAPEERLEPAPDRRPMAHPAVDAAVAEAQGARAEVQAAVQRASAAQRAYDAAFAQHYPSLGATGNFGWRGFAPDELERGFAALITLTVPLFAGGTDAARVDEAEANLNLARANLESVRRAVSLEVQETLLAHGEAASRLDAASRLEAAATEGLKLAEGRYETGLGDAVELADAQATMASARAQRVRASLDRAVAEVRLLRVLGRDVAPVEAR